MESKTKIILGTVAVVALVAIGVVVYFGLFAKSGVTNVNSAGLREAVNRGAVLIDVRTPEEYAEGHIANAILMPDTEASELMKDLPREQEYVIYCRTGNRSSGVVNWMVENGFTNIKHLNKGIVSWDGELVQGNQPGSADAGATPDNSSGTNTGSEDGTAAPQEPAQVNTTPLTSDVSSVDLMTSDTGNLVLVEFATKTCPACKQAAPVLGKIKESMSDKVDVKIYYVDENPEAAEIFQRLGGYAVPHFFFVNSKGHIVEDMLGFPGELKFSKTLKNVLGS